MLQDKFAIIVGVFHLNRITQFMESFHANPPGCKYDIYFVHNEYEMSDVKNTYDRTSDEINKINNFLDKEYYKNPKINIIHRKNVGRDMGSLWHGYNVVKNQYKYYFFINERVKIKVPNWLRMFKDAFDNDPKLGAATPQLCGAHKYPYCLRCLFWSQTNDSIKTMDWWEPKNRPDAHIQEMEMVYPHVKSLGLNCKQIGDGFNILNHFLDDGSEDFRYVINRHEFVA